MLFFNNSVGDITAVNLENGDLVGKLQPNLKKYMMSQCFLKIQI
jgi:hypothetical protein